MSKRMQFENIEAIRRQAGIEDVELREAVAALRVGDHVRITPMIGGRSFLSHTVLARITRIEGGGFRGKLTGAPACPPPPGLRIGSAVAFTASHIHSVLKAAAKS
jgi:hypothetical protein